MEGFIARPSISGLGNESKVKDPPQTKHTPLENMPSVKAQKRKLDEREPSQPDSQGLPSQHFSLQDMDTLPLPEPKPTHSPAERVLQQVQHYNAQLQQGSVDLQQYRTMLTHLLAQPSAALGD